MHIVHVNGTYQAHSVFALHPYKQSSALFVNSKSTVIEFVQRPGTKHWAGALIRINALKFLRKLGLFY